jgi:hypothetical protein
MFNLERSVRWDSDIRAMSILFSFNMTISSFTKFRMSLQFQRRIIRDFEVKKLFTIVIFNKTGNKSSKKGYKWVYYGPKF